MLKKRKRAEKWEAAEKTAAAEKEKKAKSSAETAFKRAEKYVQEYKDQQKSLVTLKRAARKAGTFYVEPEPKLLFVMRLRGINGMHPKTRHIMKVLRLLQMHNGVFMQVNKAVMNNLVKVDPYIMYGYPSLKTVRDLVYKRGYAKINGQRVPLTSNAMIENLGEKTKGEVICMEDLVHQIYNVGLYQGGHQVPVIVQDEQPVRRPPASATTLSRVVTPVAGTSTSRRQDALSPITTKTLQNYRCPSAYDVRSRRVGTVSSVSRAVVPAALRAGCGSVSHPH